MTPNATSGTKQHHIHWGTPKKPRDRPPRAERLRRPKRDWGSPIIGFQKLAIRLRCPNPVFGHGLDPALRKSRRVHVLTKTCTRLVWGTMVQHRIFGGSVNSKRVHVLKTMGNLRAMKCMSEKSMCFGKNLFPTVRYWETAGFRKEDDLSGRGPWARANAILDPFHTLHEALKTRNFHIFKTCTRFETRRSL